MGLSWPAGLVPWRKNIIHSFIAIPGGLDTADGHLSPCVQT